MAMNNLFPNEGWKPGQPSDDGELWRYIDFTQFVSILENQELWFASAAEFFDPFEGALPEQTKQDLIEQLPREIDNPERILARMYDALRYMTFVSCWHQRSEETAAMWELYRDKGKEVAIKTTVRDFSQALPDRDDLTTGSVDYKEYDIGDGFTLNRVSPFFHKRPSFQHESEYRAIVSTFEVADGARIDSEYVNKIDRETPPGVTVPVNLEHLIDEVVVSPVAGSWMMSLVDDVASTYGLDDVEVRWSNLKNDPF
jgi:hypothetical protein